MNIESIKAYVSTGGIHCPYCKAKETVSTVGAPESNEGYFELSARCDSCDKKWTEVYTLSTIVEED